MMLKRIISSVILAPFFLYLIYLGGIPFLLGCLLILGISAWEFGRIYNHDEKCKTPILLLVVMVLLMAIARYLIGFDAAQRCMTSCIMVSMIWGIGAYEHYSTKAAFGFAVLVTGLVYIGWLGSYMISLRQIDNGFWWLMLCLCLVWMNDIGAFLVGRKIGKHHMLPNVSPNKSWEGYFGGIFTALLTAFLMHVFIPEISHLLNVHQILLLGLLLSAIGAMGDFGESMIKRTFGIKDSSNLIPGHGGFLDRFDTVFWAMPIGYFFFELINSGMI
jgi:phosphatidate cytidylyltransferase